MKTFTAHDVNIRALYKALSDAGQPVIRISFNGPATQRVSLAVVCCEDSADDAVVSGIVTDLAGPAKKSAQVDATVAQLIRKVGTRS